MLDFVKKGWLVDDEEPYLIGTKCEHCQVYYFPEKKVCPQCFQSCSENIRMGNRGKVHDFTIANVAPEGIEAPYILSYVDIQEGPRVFSHLVGVDIEKIQLQEGDEVELTIGKIGTSPSGEEIIAWKYKPLNRII